MLKECDMYVKEEKLIDKLPITLIPNKYLQTESVYMQATKDRPFMNEVKYSVHKRLMKRREIYLIQSLDKVKYIGIIYPNGRVVFKKIRKVTHSKSDSIINFHCVMNRTTKNEQKKLNRWENLFADKLNGAAYE